MTGGDLLLRGRNQLSARSLIHITHGDQSVGNRCGVQRIGEDDFRGGRDAIFIHRNRLFIRRGGIAFDGLRRYLNGLSGGNLLLRGLNQLSARSLVHITHRDQRVGDWRRFRRRSHIERIVEYDFSGGRNAVFIYGYCLFIYRGGIAFDGLCRYLNGLTGGDLLLGVRCQLSPRSLVHITHHDQRVGDGRRFRRRSHIKRIVEHDFSGGRIAIFVHGYCLFKWCCGVSFDRLGRHCYRLTGGDRFHCGFRKHCAGVLIQILNCYCGIGHVEEGDFGGVCVALRVHGYRLLSFRGGISFNCLRAQRQGFARGDLLHFCFH